MILSLHLCTDNFSPFSEQNIHLTSLQIYLTFAPKVSGMFEKISTLPNLKSVVMRTSEYIGSPIPSFGTLPHLESFTFHNHYQSSLDFLSGVTFLHEFHLTNDINISDLTTFLGTQNCLEMFECFGILYNSENDFQKLFENMKKHPIKELKFRHDFDNPTTCKYLLDYLDDCNTIERLQVRNVLFPEKFAQFFSKRTNSLKTIHISWRGGENAELIALEIFTKKNSALTHLSSNCRVLTYNSIEMLCKILEVSKNLQHLQFKYNANFPQEINQMILESMKKNVSLIEWDWRPECVQEQLEINYGKSKKKYCEGN